MPQFKWLHAALVAATLCSFAPQQLDAKPRRARRYRVRVRTVPPGASVYVDDRSGGVVGTTPHRLRLTRGSHTLWLEAPGYEPFKTTISVRRSDTFTFTLRKAAPIGEVNLKAGPGSAGGSVYVDGKPYGSLPASLKLKQGTHQLEVRKEGFTSWKATVEVHPRTQQSLTVQMQQKAVPTGSLLVVTNIPGAKVELDGKPVTTLPRIEKLTPGSHALRVSAPGHVSQVQVVKVSAGKTATATFDLKPVPKTPTQTATLNVLSNVPATVFVDGVSKGASPANVTELLPGRHIVQLKAAGYKNAEQTVEVAAGQVQTVKFTLEPTEQKVQAEKPSRLIVDGAVNGAEVLVNDRVVGNLPHMEVELPAGEYRIEVRADGHHPYRRTIALHGAETKIRIQMKKIETPKTSAETRDQALLQGYPKGLSSYGAFLVAPTFFTADVSGGFPDFGQGRLTTGVFSTGHLGLDASVEFGSYGAMTTIGLMTKLRVINWEPLATAIMLSLGGGGGPASRNTFYLNLGAVFSISFKRLVTFTARAYMNYYTDRHCPSSQQNDEISICQNPPASLGTKDPRDRFGKVRLMVGAILEVPISTHLSIFGMVEGAPFQAQRMAFTDNFASVMPGNDPRIYGRAGVTFKF